MAKTHSEAQLDLFADGIEVAGRDAATTFVEAADPLPVDRGSVVVRQSTAAPAGWPDSEMPAAEERAGISDAGEELVANRRNRVRVGKDWSDLSGLNAALKVKEAVKGNVWVKPDYQQLIDDGMQPLVAHVFKQVYDSVAAKPAVRAGMRISDEQLKTYVDTLRKVEQGLSSWSSDREALKVWATSNARAAGAMLGHRVSLSDLVETSSLLNRVFPDGWRAHRDAIRLAGGNKLLGALQPGYDEIKRAMKAIDEGWPRKREAWEVQGFKVVEKPLVEIHRGFKSDRYSLVVGGHFVSTHDTEEMAEAARAEVKPFLLTAKRGFVGTFDTEEQAIEEAKTRAGKAKAKSDLAVDKGYNVALAERVGPARRLPGEDISSERLMSEFGFRGVNFGNWMKTPAARAEAQLHLNHAYDAMHDLAEILNVPPKAMSLGGMLGLAFGAQGRGGAFAGHFVPGVNEMNLTRTAGAGVLAHEYGHALDHYFARQAGLDTAEVPFLSEHAELPAEMTRHQVVDGKMKPVTMARFGEVRPAVLAGFKSLVSVMKKRLQTPEEAQGAEAAQIERLNRNVNGWLASIRKDFGGIESEFDTLAEKVRSGDVGEGRAQVGATTLLSPVVSQMRDLYKAKHGRVYSIDQLKGLQSNLDSLLYRREKAAHMATVEVAEKASPERRSVSTDYMMAAAALDKDKGGKPYWATNCELFARAFDSYVADKLDKANGLNSYLSFGVREDRSVPNGRDRDAIHEAFDQLISEFCVRETEMGPALFSVEQGRALDSRISRADIEAEVDRMREQWVNMPPVYVVDRVTDLPFDAPAQADGAYHDGKVYVVAGNIVDLKQVQKVMAHECVLHHSMEEMLGAYGFAKLIHGVQSLKAKGDSTVVALAEDVRSRYGDLPADIETKEIVARAGEKCLDERGDIRVEYGFMKGVFAGVAGWLRDHGVSVPFTNIELQGILHQSGQWARGDRSQGEARDVKPAAKSVTERIGRFVGRILYIGDGVVTQRVNRDGATVVHSLAHLSGSVEVGDLAEIAYEGGQGIVRDEGRQRGVER